MPRYHNPVSGPDRSGQSFEGDFTVGNGKDTNFMLHCPPF
jgi:hypothetical protein